MSVLAAWDEEFNQRTHGMASTSSVRYLRGTLLSATGVLFCVFGSLSSNGVQKERHLQKTYSFLE